MNDLLDLDFTTTSNTKSTIPKPKGNPNYGQTTFENLAAASTSNFNSNSIKQINNPSSNLSRSNSPFLSTTSTSNSGTNGLRSTTLLSLSTSASGSKGASNSSNSGNDAFASLFGNGSSSSSNSNSNEGMVGGGGNKSMAERLANNSSNGNMNGNMNGLNWSSLTPTSTGNSSSSNSRQPSPNLSSTSTSYSQSQRTSSIPPPPSSSSSSYSPNISNNNSNKKSDPWDFDLLSTTTSKSISTSIQKPNLNSFDSFNNQDEADDGLGDFLPSSTTSNSKNKPPSTSTLNLNARRDSFDYMGIFSSPPPPSSTTTSPPLPFSSASNSKPKRKEQEEAPPPPHILGQLIEMGFSILDSTNALKSSRILETGAWNVEGAVGILSSSSSFMPRQQQEEDPPVLKTGRKAREAASLASSRSSTPTPTIVTQIQSTELFSTATKLGFSVFKSATEFYSTGREAVKKVLVDEGIVGGGSTGEEGGGKGKGRPRWMNDAAGEQFGEEEAGGREKKREESNGNKGGGKTLLFQDSDDEGIEISPSFSGGSSQIKKQVDSVLPQRPIVSKSNSNGSGRQEIRGEGILSRSSTPTLISTSNSTPTASTSRPLQQQHQPPQSKATSIPPKPFIPSRQLVTATPSQLSLSSTHKSKGNEYFKLGLFSESIKSYTLAIESLPPKHLNLLIFFNNRGMARIKIGDEIGCIEDCEIVIEIITGISKDDVESGIGIGIGKKINWLELEKEDQFNSSTTSKVGGNLPNLREQLSKAIFKRAKALEIKEKWSKALEDYKLLLEGGEIVMNFVGGIKIIADGSARCRKMVDGNNINTTPTIRKKEVVPSIVKKAPPSSTTSTNSNPIQSSGQAVQALRTANATALAEEDLRLSLKDSIDLKITNWKKGKETNLRALIASLDNVLWNELDWKKVGMHELITDGQVKIRYVRAIGKVHPDKLNVNNTTVEQRMIAGAVFSALNDAFKSSR